VLVKKVDSGGRLIDSNSVLNKPPEFPAPCLRVTAKGKLSSAHNCTQLEQRRAQSQYYVNVRQNIFQSEEYYQG
jgi:hypothetical protein